MKTFTQDGNVLSFAAPYAVASGAGFQVGSLFAVAQTAAASTAAVEGCIIGTFTLAKLTGTAWTMGAPIYWDDSAKLCTLVVSTNKLIGYAAALLGEASAKATGSVLVRGL